MSRTLLTLDLHQQQDVVVARQRARQIAALLGFDAQDQIRLATAVSEIARNAYQYAGRGAIEFFVEEQTHLFMIKVVDKGPGIKDVQAVLEGRSATSNGKNTGMGINSVRRLMDRFQMESLPATGTSVAFGKAMPKRSAAVRDRDLTRVMDELAQETPQNPFDEVRVQNQELLRTLEELRQRQADLASAHEELKRREAAVSELNRELEDTNRGVVALYAELEEKAEFLGRASEMKSRFLSNMSHEFRTPLNAITGLTRLLLGRVDGELTPEQEKQVSLIRRASESLMELVNDLLDLAKVEAGKVSIRPAEFEVASLFGGLRGMLRPLLTGNSSVDLVFEEPGGVSALFTDESKVSQILRNFISNALKFTDCGEIRVAAASGPDDTVIFSVADTGIGIALQDQTRIFEEYAQVEGPHQTRSKGTGLGLPLVKKLANLLGGRVRLTSELGKGSTFSVVLPRVYEGPAEVSIVPEVSTQLDPLRRPVLVVEDNREALFIYEKYLKGSGFQVIPAPNLSSARQALTRFRPCAIVLDVLLDRESGWDLLTELKQAEDTRGIPVLVVTLVENEAKALALGAEGYCAKPVDRGWLLKKLMAITTRVARRTVLLIDDDEASRYLLREGLKNLQAQVIEAETGSAGLRQALAELPSAIFLDLELPDRNGLDILRQLKEEPKTRHIPVIINTSKVLGDVERRAMAEAGALAVLSKEKLGEEGPSLLRKALEEAGLFP